MSLARDLIVQLWEPVFLLIVLAGMRIAIGVVKARRDRDRQR